MSGWRLHVEGQTAHLVDPAGGILTVPSSAVSWAGGMAVVHIAADASAELPAGVTVHAHYPAPRPVELAAVIDQLNPMVVQELLAQESAGYGLDTPMGLIAMGAVRRAILGDTGT